MWTSRLLYLVAIFFQVSPNASTGQDRTYAFSFSFGANGTTFVYRTWKAVVDVEENLKRSPAGELFPTRIRGFAHGISAASGKVGALIAALAFSVLQAKTSTAAVVSFSVIRILWYAKVNLLWY